jgi:pyruvate-formate lyase-activating enzyme
MAAWHGAVVSAPVDAIYSDYGIRARRLPGLVDFRERRAIAPSMAPSAEALAAIEGVIAGQPGFLSVLKARAFERSAGQVCPGCGGDVYDAQIDMGVGPNAGLAIENIEGRWCGECLTATLADEGRALRRRLESWLKAREHADRFEPSFSYETPDHPRSVQFEISTRCNLACGYCSNRLLADKRDTTLDAFAAAADRIRWSELCNVDFTGLGESTLNPDLLGIVREAARRAPHATIRLVSNGVAASAESLQMLIDGGLTALAFSIDTLDPRRFAKARGGASLEKAMRNIEAIAQMRRARPGDTVRLRLKAVLVDDPYGEAEQLLRWSAGLGMDMPHFSVLDSRANAQGVYTDQSDLHQAFPSTDIGAAFVQWTEERWHALGGAPLRPEPAATRHYVGERLQEGRNLCRWAQDAAFVAIDGTILTCCESMMDIPRSSVGAITTGDLQTAWRGDMLWQYRLPLSLGLLPEGCVGCTLAPVLQPA